MNNEIICPVNCKYCMASKIEKRSQYWKMGEKIGMNKSCTFINRFPSDPPLKDMNIDWSLFDGEYLGFQGITDCFWNKYYDDLCWLIKKVKNSKIKKLVLTSKIPINEKYIKLFNSGYDCAKKFLAKWNFKSYISRYRNIDNYYRIFG